MGTKIALADGAESDDSYWDSDEEDTSSSSDDDTKYANLKEKFLKVAGGDDDKKKKPRMPRLREANGNASRVALRCKLNPRCSPKTPRLTLPWCSRSCLKSSLPEAKRELIAVSR